MAAAERTQRMADLELVQRVLQGDRRAVPLLAERLACVPGILQVRNRRAGRPIDDHELADLAQDVLLIAWRKLAAFEGHSVLPAWVHVICTFEFKNAARKKSRTPRPAGIGTGDDSEAVFEPVAWVAKDPWEYEDVHLGLRRIGNEEAQVIWLKHFDGLTFDEIGKQLGLAQSTVKHRYYRGIAELRWILGEGKSES